MASIDADAPDEQNHWNDDAVARHKLAKFPECYSGIAAGSMQQSVPVKLKRQRTARQRLGYLVLEYNIGADESSEDLVALNNVSTAHERGNRDCSGDAHRLAPASRWRPRRWLAQLEKPQRQDPAPIASGAG
jgi:hypothetical protein